MRTQHEPDPPPKSSQCVDLRLLICCDDNTTEQIFSELSPLVLVSLHWSLEEIRVTYMKIECSKDIPVSSNTSSYEYNVTDTVQTVSKVLRTWTSDNRETRGVL